MKTEFESGGSMGDLPKNDDVMNYKQLSAYLKLGETTLRPKVMKGTIPSFKIDGAVRLSKKDIDEWLKEHKRNNKNIALENQTPENETDLFSADGGEL